MGLADEGVEIAQRAQLGIHGAVVANGVVGAQRPLRPASPIGWIGISHTASTPHSVQEFELSGGGLQRTLGGQLAHIHFIEDGIVCPCGCCIVSDFMVFLQKVKISITNITKIFTFRQLRPGYSVQTQ